MADLAVSHFLHLGAVDTHFLEEEVADVLAFHKDAFEQVHRFHILLSALLCAVDSLLDGFLCLDGEFVEVHDIFSFLILFF